VCLSTSCPVRNLFANVVWCDVDPLSGNLDPRDVARKLTPRTKAIIAFHWAGNPVEIDAVRDVARGRNIAVIEDAGEALGAEYQGRKIGATGSDYTVFSFYPNRHLTTIEGAAIACARSEDYESLRWVKRYGIHQPSFRDGAGEINPASDIPVAGWNSYMNHVAATLGLAQMEHLPSIVARYQANGSYYDQRLADVPGIRLLRRPVNSLPAYWVYTLLAENAEDVLQRLREEGIQASRVHLRNDLYSSFGASTTRLPGVDCFARSCVSIPCGWWVSDADRSRIADILCNRLRVSVNTTEDPLVSS
jgi:perosamine synthetase